MKTIIIIIYTQDFRLLLKQEIIKESLGQEWQREILRPGEGKPINYEPLEQAIDSKEQFSIKEMVWKLINIYVEEERVRLINNMSGETEVYRLFINWDEYCIIKQNDNQDQWQLCDAESARKKYDK